MKASATACALAGLLSLVGCASRSVGSGGAFSTDWQNDSGQAIAAVEATLRDKPRVANAAVAVGVGAGGLFGASLDGRAHWSHAGHFRVLPSITARLVIADDGEEIHALDAESGAQRWSTSARGRTLRGAGGDGESIALVLAQTGKSDLLLGVSATGSVQSVTDSSTSLGHPAVRGGVAFVPWGDQYVSAIELSSGSELGRALLREKVSQALNFAGEIYFGEVALVHLDEKIRFGDTNQARRVGLPKLALPGSPHWLDDGTRTSLISDSARNKIRLYASPAGTDGNLKLGGALASYFRVALGLNPETGALRWVRALPDDVVGGAAAQSGFALCDSSGKLWLLDAEGNDAGSANLGAKVEECVVDTGKLVIPQHRARAPLAQQIADALDTLEPDMATAERYLLEQLGKISEPRVTKTLIDLSSSPRLPPELRNEARELLGKRTSGTEYMLAALERHYDFVAGVLLPPPVAPLADSLAAAKETRAAPLLAKHLNDPANSAEDVLHAARALETLATPAEYEDLRTFFTLYRATADDPALVEAVGAVAVAMLRVGGAPARELLERAESDPLTVREVKTGLDSLLTSQAAPSASGPSKPAEK